MVLQPILKVIGSQPIHVNFDPPTALTSLLHGIMSLGSKLNFAICCGPAKHPVCGFNVLMTGVQVIICLIFHL